MVPARQQSFVGGDVCQSGTFARQEGVCSLIAPVMPLASTCLLTSLPQKADYQPQFSTFSPATPGSAADMFLTNGGKPAAFDAVRQQLSPHAAAALALAIHHLHACQAAHHVLPPCRLVCMDSIAGARSSGAHQPAGSYGRERLEAGTSGLGLVVSSVSAMNGGCCMLLACPSKTLNANQQCQASAAGCPHIGPLPSPPPPTLQPCLQASCSWMPAPSAAWSCCPTGRGACPAACCTSSTGQLLRQGAARRGSSFPTRCSGGAEGQRDCGALGRGSL